LCLTCFSERGAMVWVLMNRRIKRDCFPGVAELGL
jgi:hypothetical protein